MKLHKLKRASDYRVREWLEKELELNDYQKSIIRDDYNDFIRFSPFEFYEREDPPKSNIAWRLTFPAFGLYWLILISFMPIKWLFTGSPRYNENSLVIYSKWSEKISG